jgi:NAD+-dependent secondary alcohol dehydrogenase Adh1
MSATSIGVVDRSEDALKLASEWGADETVVEDGGQVDTEREMTDGHGAPVVIDFVGEGGTPGGGLRHDPARR